MTVEQTKKDLVESLPRFYNDSKEVDAILQADAVEVDNIREQARLLLQQLTVPTATYALSDWERVLAIPVRPNRSDEYRRTRIITKLLGSKPATMENMLAIVNAHTRTNDSRIIELPQPGTVLFEANIENGVDVDALLEDIRTYIPAHLAYQFVSASKAKIYSGAAIQTGGMITVFPYSIKSIQLNAAYSQGGATINSQTTTVYPKGDGQ